MNKCDTPDCDNAVAVVTEDDGSLCMICGIGYLKKDLME